MKKVLSFLLMLVCISSGVSAQTQCKAITKKGTQCTREAITDGYCNQHYKMIVEDNDSSSKNRCQATTKKGTQCTRRAVTQGYCKQHYDMMNDSVNNKTVTCKAITKNGKRCSRKATRGVFCKQHSKKFKTKK